MEKRNRQITTACNTGLASGGLTFKSEISFRNSRPNAKPENVISNLIKKKLYKMSYDISLYRIETKEKEQKSNDEEFFDKEENLVPFTEEQYQELKGRLLEYGYETTEEGKYGLSFFHKNEDYGTALLTKEALFFTASWNEDSIFEVGMTASEFTDTGEFAKYDPQNDGWEEI